MCTAIFIYYLYIFFNFFFFASRSTDVTKEGQLEVETKFNPCLSRLAQFVTGVYNVYRSDDMYVTCTVCVRGLQDVWKSIQRDK